MKTTQDGIDAATERWEAHVASHKPRRPKGDTAFTCTVIALVVVVALFIPTDRASYINALKGARQNALSLAYWLPCKAPASSFIGKWARSQKAACT